MIKTSLRVPRNMVVAGVLCLPYQPTLPASTRPPLMCRGTELPPTVPIREAGTLVRRTRRGYTCTNHVVSSCFEGPAPTEGQAPSLRSLQFAAVMRAQSMRPDFTTFSATQATQCGGVVHPDRGTLSV